MKNVHRKTREIISKETESPQNTLIVMGVVDLWSRDSVSRYTDAQRAGSFRDRAVVHVLLHTSPHQKWWAHPASCTVHTGALSPGVKWAGNCFDYQASI